MAKANPPIRNRKDKAAALFRQGALAEAKALYQQVCQADQRDLDSWVALGSVHGQLNEFKESARCFRHAVQLQPDSPEAHFNLAKVLRALKQPAAAEKHYRQALALKPRWLQALNNLGNLLHELERDEEAADCYRQALAIEPDYVEAKFNYANLQQARGQYTEAIERYRELLAAHPGHAMLLSNLARALAMVNQLEAALECYDRILAIAAQSAPAYADAAYNKSLYQLLRGEYREGWRLHEWRWRTEQFKPYVRHFDRPVWLGETSLAGKTILLHAEQGLGDTIQFVRYVPLVEELAANVILELPAKLISLVATLKGSFKLVAKGESLPEFDLHCPLMSLPLALGTAVDTIPADIPYLAADPDMSAVWRQRLGQSDKARIGLVWSGNRQHLNDRHRSIPLRILAPLLDLDFEFHALQNEVREEDQAFLKESGRIQPHEEGFAETAALISTLDLVITADTAMAHLAGALGKPVWVLLPYVPDFRWLQGRDDSPWYPTARLFRQSRPGDWGGVVDDVVAALEQRRHDAGK